MHNLRYLVIVHALLFEISSTDCHDHVYVLTFSLKTGSHHLHPWWYGHGGHAQNVTRVRTHCGLANFRGRASL